MRLFCQTLFLLVTAHASAYHRNYNYEKEGWTSYSHTTHRPSTTTTKSVTTTDFYDYPSNEQHVETTSTTERACEQLNSSHVLEPTIERKAWRKCIEYQERVVFPCARLTASTPHKSRQGHCGHGLVQTLITGGTNAEEKEYPHMVMLTFERIPKNINEGSWGCSGTIISDYFILTAAHCTTKYSGRRNSHNVTYARTRALKRSEKIDLELDLYSISSVINHPGHKHPKKYHDIALLKTSRQMYLDEFAVPACLDVGPIPGKDSGVNYNEVEATGWGLTAYSGRKSDILQKVKLEYVDYAICMQHHPKGGLLKTGIDQNTMLCYRGANNSEGDACQGDSGGSIVVRNSQFKCMYTAVGVVSYGKGCGDGVPGLYTRVSAYLAWIEKEVWPDN